MARLDVPAEAIRKGSGVQIYYVNEFASDWDSAAREANVANDRVGLERMRILWFDYFGEQLRLLDAQALIDYLEKRHVWRRYAEWPVFKTIDTPCLAFTAYVDERGGDVTLTALGICYRYPLDDAEEWWQKVILPRVKGL
jgi:hypothetical protein